MADKCKKILLQIQEKKDKMLKCAKIYGYTSEDTIRCSQELDQLIYEYQLLMLYSEIPEDEGKFPFKKVMLVLPRKLTETKYEILT